MGKVWFTVSVGVHEAGAEPTPGGVAARLMAITTTTVLTGGLLFGMVGGASGITSSMGVKRDGVYAVRHTRPCVRVRVRVRMAHLVCIHARALTLDSYTRRYTYIHTYMYIHIGLPLPRRSRGTPR